MAEATLEAASRRNKHYPNRRHPDELAPDDVPEIYASICKGECLNPLFEDGACLVFSKSQPIEPGDFVGFWLHPDAVADGELPRRVKRLVMGLPPGCSLPYRPQPGDEIEPVLILEQLNPRKAYYVPASRILAMHRVIGEAAPDGTGQARVVSQVIDGKMVPFADVQPSGRA